jgi:F-type H+-transporting ATPase subunit delta
VTGGLAKRYARALLDLAREAGTLDATGGELASLAATFDEPLLRAVALNPAIEAGARHRVVGGVVGALGVSPAVGNLARLLADRDRLAILPQVAKAYDALVDAEMGRTRVHVRSAAPVGPAEQQELTALARRLVGGGDVVISTEVDPELLGGVALDVGGTVWDGSVRTQLERISKEMAGGGA